MYGGSRRGFGRRCSYSYVAARACAYVAREPTPAVCKQSRRAESVEEHSAALADAAEVRRLLAENTQEVESFLKALNGEFVPPAAGGDLLRDGPGVLPTGVPPPAGLRPRKWNANVRFACHIRNDLDTSDLTGPILSQM